MIRQEVLNTILSQCQGQSGENTLFGSWVTPYHPVILKVKEVYGVDLKPKDLEKKRVGRVADIVIERMNS